MIDNYDVKSGVIVFKKYDSCLLLRCVDKLEKFAVIPDTENRIIYNDERRTQPLQSKGCGLLFCVHGD